MAKKRKRRKGVRPDEVVHMGPLRLTRFGRLVRWENRATEAQHAAFMRKLEEIYPKICAEIDGLVSRITDTVSLFDPLQLLHRSFWEYLTQNMGVPSEIEHTQEANETRLILDYLQSMICAIPPRPEIKETISEEEWSALTGDIKALYRKFQVDYFMARTAWEKQNDPNYDPEVEDYQVPAQMHWLAVRGTRYLSHDLPHFKDLLSPHDDVFRSLFGIGVEEFLHGLSKIFHSLTHGPMESMEELRRFKKTTLSAMEESIEAGATETDPGVLLNKVIAEHEWDSWRDKVVNNVRGFGLFELDTLTSLPLGLLDALSWSPGEDQEFLSDGPYRGWPLRVLPIWKRPFLKVSDKHYCFGLYALTDHLYRIIQRAILKLEPSYKEEWNRRQKEISESLPIDLLSRILPGADIYRSVHYQWQVGGENGKQWCETDGLLLYDDHLIVVEVKAGAFTHTPPSTDFPAYIRSLDQLLKGPAQQAIRFSEYLDSAPEVTIYDKEHRPIRQMRRSDYRHITRCCVTLDQLTEYAARAQAMKKIGIDVGQQPVWNISIDDLRVFADVFRNPLVFCHFLEERAQAYMTLEMESDDELDHLGLYLAHNRYTIQAKDLSNSISSSVNWRGYRLEIDRYYSERIISGESAKPPSQKIPQRLAEILNSLAKSNEPGRCRAASWLLDLDGGFRFELAQFIENTLTEQLSTLRLRPVTIFGTLPISIYCWIEGKIHVDLPFVKLHTLATLRRANEKERLALELFFGEDGRLQNARYTFFRPTDIHFQDLPQLDAYEQRMIKERVQRSLKIGEKRKIGRNERCPCGSGKKYKKCFH